MGREDVETDVKTSIPVSISETVSVTLYVLKVAAAVIVGLAILRLGGGK